MNVMQVRTSPACQKPFVCLGPWLPKASLAKQQVAAMRSCIAAAASPRDPDGGGAAPPGASASSASSSSGSGASPAGGNTSDDGRPLAPWSLTFDLRERETLWTEENQARLVRIVAGYELDLDIEEVEQRLEELQVLLPNLAARVAHIKPSTLAGLLRDPGALVPRIITLRQLLPTADINKLAAAEPELLLLRDLGELQRDLDRLAQVLGLDVNLDAIVEQQPRFLDAELVSEVLAELQRLMPGGNAVRTLVADPSWLLRVERGTKRLGDHPDM